MLTKQQVSDIKRLLDEGELSQRRIAVHVKVSRGSVAAIASGKRGLHGREHEGDLFAQSDHAERCPGCGYMVFVPCVYCRAIEFSDRRNPDTEDSQQPLPDAIEEGLEGPMEGEVAQEEPAKSEATEVEPAATSTPTPSPSPPAHEPVELPSQPHAWKQCA